MRQLYRGKILKHFKEPHNEGAVADADVEAHVENPHCGDAFTFTAAVDDGTITDIGFEGGGCALSTAAASLLLDELDGGPVSAIDDLEDGTVFDMLGIQKDDIAPVRVKCVLLPKNGVEELVSNR